MELIQFKSINGRKYENLQVIWAAINPKEDDEGNSSGYFVEEMDPAQKDMFHIHIEIPYDVSRTYFVDRYGVQHGNAACDWWGELPVAIKEKISPRRLDYAIQVFKVGGEVRDTVLPREANTGKLIKALTKGSPIQQLQELAKSGDKDEIKKFVRDPNNWASVKEIVCTDGALHCIVLPYVPFEHISVAMTDHPGVERFVMNNPDYFEKILEVLAIEGKNYTTKNKAMRTLENYKKTKKSAPSSLNNFDMPPELPKSWENTKKLALRTLAFDGYSADDVLKPAMKGSKDLAVSKTKCLKILQNIKTASSLFAKESAVMDTEEVISENMDMPLIKACLRVLDRYVLRTNAKNVAENDRLKELTNILVTMYIDASTTYNAAAQGLPKEDIFQFIEDFPALTTKYIWGHVHGQTTPAGLPFKIVNNRRNKSIPNVTCSFQRKKNTSAATMEAQELPDSAENSAEMF
jgi:hypothetical protein